MDQRGCPDTARVGSTPHTNLEAGVPWAGAPRFLRPVIAPVGQARRIGQLLTASDMTEKIMSIPLYVIFVYQSVLFESAGLAVLQDL